MTNFQVAYICGCVLFASQDDKAVKIGFFTLAINTVTWMVMALHNKYDLLKEFGF